MLIDRYAEFRVNVETLSKNLQKFENSKMSSMGMRGIHALCLFKLGHSAEGLTAAELSSACEVDKALISRVVSELHEGGYIATKDPEKGRYRRKLVLTPKGRTVLRTVTHLICSSIKDLKDEITVEELDTFYKVMLILNKHLVEG